MICWFLLVPAGVLVLVSLFVSYLVPVLVSLLLSSLVPVLVSLLLSSFFLKKGVLLHHDLLVPLGSGRGSGACLPSSLFLFSSGKGFWSVPSWISWFLLFQAGVPMLVSLLLPFYPSGKGFCFIMDFLIHPASGWGSGAGLPSSFFFLRKGVLFLHGFPGSSCFGLGFRCLSPFFSFLYFPQERGSVPSWISWFLLLRAGVPVLVFLLLSSFFS